jgi:phosphoribosyl-ATP pyrophosphohydrolase/phosphoribosyl-AMP cyclohydrolase
MNLANLDWSKGAGLVPAIVQDHDTDAVLMLGFLNKESLEATLTSGNVTFFSRSRQTLWVKGETSGHFLKFVSLVVDCDGDTVLIRAHPQGPTCHLGSPTCFGELPPVGAINFLRQLSEVIDSRIIAAEPSSSYVAKLYQDGLDRIAQKVGEEAIETIIAAKNNDLADFEGEAADLLFHLMVLLKAKGSSLGAISEVLRKRHK